MVKYTAYHKEDKNNIVVIDMPDNEKIFPMEVKDKVCGEGWFPWTVYEKLRARKATKEDIQRYNEIPPRELKYFCYLCIQMKKTTTENEDDLRKYVNKEALWTHLVVHHNLDKQSINMIDLRPYEIKREKTYCTDKNQNITHQCKTFRGGRCFSARKCKHQKPETARAQP